MREVTMMTMMGQEKVGTTATVAQNVANAGLLQGTDGEAYPAPAAAVVSATTTRSAVSGRSLHLSDASSTCSGKTRKAHLARLQRSKNILPVAAERKAKKVLLHNASALFIQLYFTISGRRKEQQTIIHLARTYV